MYTTQVRIVANRNPRATRRGSGVALRCAVVAAIALGAGLTLGSDPADAACKRSKRHCVLHFAGLYLHHGNDPARGISAEVDRTTHEYNEFAKGLPQSQR